METLQVEEPGTDNRPVSIDLGNFLENDFTKNNLKVKAALSRKGLTVEEKDKTIHIETSMILRAKLGDEKSDNAKLFNVSFIEVQSNLHWKRKSVTFQTEGEGEGETWVDKINQLIEDGVSTRPKKILVFINPSSGKKKAEELYKKIAAPIFELANVKTDVIVTKDGDHAPSVIAEYDLSTVDGVVPMGGDGTMATILNALVKRTMKDAEKDFNDPAEEYVQPKVSIGYLPGGTAQRIAHNYFTTADLETCALHIVCGKRFQVHTYGSFNNKKLMGYGTLCPTLGMFADMAVRAEQKRNLGIFRFVPVFYSLLKNVRTFEAEVKYLPKDCENTDNNNDAWKSVEGTYCSIDAFLGDRPRNIVNDGVLYLHLAKTNSAMHMMKYIGRLAKPSDENAFDLEFLDNFETTAFKVTFKKFGQKEGETEYFTYDAEIFALEHPEVFCKIQKNGFTMLGREYTDVAERQKIMEELKGKK